MSCWQIHKIMLNPACGNTYNPGMLKLEKSLSSWGTPEFRETFISEVSRLSLEQLPLQQAMRTGNMASLHNLAIMLNQQHQDHDFIYVYTGVFFSSLISGCSCADDPTPVDYNTEYCELQFRINKKCATTHISIIDRD